MEYRDRFCSSCSSGIEAGDPFCRKCGKNLDKRTRPDQDPEDEDAEKKGSYVAYVITAVVIVVWFIWSSEYGMVDRLIEWFLSIPEDWDSY